MRPFLSSLFAAAALAALAAPAARVSAAPLLQPHAVTYDFKLISASAGSGVAGAGGQMIFRMEDACRGWQVEQKSTITVALAQSGGTFSFGWSLDSWEGKDGQDYRFFLKRLSQGEQEDYSGSASLKDMSVKVTNAEGDAVEGDLPEGTLFPTAFTAKTIAAAQAGDVLLGGPLYDGGGEGEVYDVSVIFGKEVKQGEDLPDAALDGLRSWLVRAAFYDVASGQSEPDQEQAFRLFENGVIDRLQLDLGDFVIEGRISAYEALPSCE